MPRNLHPSRPGRVWAVLALALPLLGAGVSAPRDGSGLKLTIASIARATVGDETAEKAPQSTFITYYARAHERLVVSVNDGLPGRARLYPLVRREGESSWRVQPPAVGPGGRNQAGDWTAEIELGEPTSLGARFEVQVIAAAEALPFLLSAAMKARSSLAESATVQVERFPAAPSVGIAAILAAAPGDAPAGAADPQYVFGDAELRVHDRSLVQLVAANVPAGARVGVVVQSVASGVRRVRPDLVAGDGLVLTFFGEPEAKPGFDAAGGGDLQRTDTGEANETSFHYEVSAFVAWEAPPADQDITAADWRQLRTHLLAESRPVRVVRWQRQLAIEQIGRDHVYPGPAYDLPAERRVDVRGAARRKLLLHERIWIACVPPELNKKPWIAGDTTRLSPSGHWTVHAVDLRQNASSERFVVLAVVSSGVAGEPPPASELRGWLDAAMSEDRSAPVSVVALGGAESDRRP